MPGLDRDQFARLDTADRFFLMCYTHDSDIIKPRLHTRGIELGLAAALLTEGIVAGGIGIRDGNLIAYNPHANLDQLGRIIMTDLVREDEHDVRSWLEYLSQNSHRMVGNRLHAKHVLIRSRKQGLLGAKVRYQTVDPAAALVLEGVVLGLLSGDYPDRDSVELADVVVATLAHATGLVTSLVWDDYRRVARAQLDRLNHSLPPPLLLLVRHTEAAVASATIHHRR